MSEELSAMQQQLVAWLQIRMPEAGDLAVSELQKPGMGLSSETYLFDVTWKEGVQPRSLPVVMRAAPQSRGVFPEYDLNLQFGIMKILKENTDVPVAEMLWLEEDPSVVGAPFFLMKRLQGDVPPDFPSYHGSGMYFEATPEIRRKMWWGTVDNIVKLHKLDWKALRLDFVGIPGPGTDPVDRQLAYWGSYLNDWIKDSPDESHPTMEATLAWLEANRYAPERIGLCWGDARIGNTLYSRPDRDVLAIMDWEMAFLGDPECDLAWVFTIDGQASRGYGLRPLDGTPTREEVVRRYEERTGWQVKNLFYNEVLATFRFGLTVIAAMKNLRSKGIPIGDDMILNSYPTRQLSRLLGLPSPGPDPYAEDKVDINQLTVSVQFHLTGPRAHDWHLVSEKGRVSRHPGCVENPNCTLKASAEDWEAVVRGELNRLEAWSSGRLVTDGDLGLLSMLEEAIAKYSLEK
jgi:aminoglycoside phosphotransferase (APT) family kinase protein/putative sterol carrier protein